MTNQGLARRRSDAPRASTLLELVFEMSEPRVDDQQVVATAQHLIRTGQVRLTGNFRNAPAGAF